MAVLGGGGGSYEPGTPVPFARFAARSTWIKGGNRGVLSRLPRPLHDKKGVIGT